MGRVGHALAVAAIAIGAIIGTSLVVLALTSGGDESVSYRLRAETMIPLDGPIDPESIGCPVEEQASPIAFSPTGVLAEELPLYEGELVAVRVGLSPFKGPLPETVTFDAIWPEAVTGSPTCAYLVGQNSGASATLTWEQIIGGATFTVEDLDPTATHTVEIWLTSAEPVPQTAFWTSLTTPETGDSVVIEPLGGRVIVDQRTGGPANLMLEQLGSSVEDGTFEVLATISNANLESRSRVLDAQLSIEARDVTWTPSSVNDSIECEAGATLVCDLGGLLPGEQVVVAAVGSLREGWRPGPVRCRTNEASNGVGVCVSASVESDGVSRSEAPAVDLLIEAAASNGPLTFTSDVTPLVVRSDEVSDLRLSLTTASTGISAVEIIDSDCVEIVRVDSSLDDGDAFLVPGETWVYNCRVQLSDSKVVRIDLAAVGPGSEALAESLGVPTIVIDPDLDIAVASPAGPERTVLIDVTNGGVGDLAGIAFTAPSCDSLVITSGSVVRLLEGETVQFGCVLGEAEFDLTSVAAYATDEAGLPVIGTP